MSVWARGSEFRAELTVTSSEIPPGQFSQHLYELFIVKREGLVINETNQTLQSIIQASPLASSEVHYRRLFESAKDGILILDANTGRIVITLPAMETEASKRE
jgi:PAS domain-containing protein